MPFHNNTAGRNFRFSSLPRDVTRRYKMYESSLVKVSKLKNHKEFMLQCIQEQVIPRNLDVGLVCDNSPFNLANKIKLQDRVQKMFSVVNMKINMIHTKTLSIRLNGIIRNFINCKL